MAGRDRRRRSVPRLRAFLHPESGQPAPGRVQGGGGGPAPRRMAAGAVPRSALPRTARHDAVSRPLLPGRRLPDGPGTPCRTATDRHAGGDLRRRDHAAGSRLDPAGRARRRRPVPATRAVAARPALLPRRRHPQGGIRPRGAVLPRPTRPRRYRRRRAVRPGRPSPRHAAQGAAGRFAGAPRLRRGLRLAGDRARRPPVDPAFAPGISRPPTPAPGQGAGGRASMPSSWKARRRPSCSATGATGASTASARPDAAMPPSPFRGSGAIARSSPSPRPRRRGKYRIEKRRRIARLLACDRSPGVWREVRRILENPLDPAPPAATSPHE